MTAHVTKSVITPERIRWFADYYKRNPEWGVFHVCLSDGNWRCGADALVSDQDVQEAARWFGTLTPSQRRRLGQKAADLANTITGPGPGREGKMQP